MCSNYEAVSRADRLLSFFGVARDRAWLNDPGHPPHRYGDHSALKRPYLPEDYLRDTAGSSAFILSGRAS